MKTPRIFADLVSATALALVWGAALPQSAALGSTASVSVGTGPHAGTYNFAPTSPCVITAFGDKPAGVSVVLSSENSSLEKE